MKTRFSQQGLSMTGWMAVLFVISFFITCAVKITPLYLDAWTAQTAIENVVNKQRENTESIKAIRSAIGRQFLANRVKVVNPRTMKITKKNGKVIIDARYEQREPLFYNIDVVIKFDHLLYEITPNSAGE
jgi:hypothetical protein